MQNFAMQMLCKTFSGLLTLLIADENLLLDAMDSVHSLSENVTPVDPIVKLNKDGTDWLCNYLKCMHLMDKLVGLKATRWSKDLLFRYFEVMEELQENLCERQAIMSMLDEWIMAVMNRDDIAQHPMRASQQHLARVRHEVRGKQNN